MSAEPALRTHAPRRRAHSVVTAGLLAALVVALAPGTALAQRRGSDSVAPFVEQQFYDLQTWGDPVAARIVEVDGYSVADLTDYTTAIGAGFPERHYQGIARNSGPDGTPYLHLTRNRNPNRLCFLTGLGFNPECFNFGPGEYSVVEMASRDKSGERMRSNRLAKDAEFDDTLPPEVDKFVRSLRFDGRNGMPRAYHPSGIALIDDVLLIGFDTGCGEADATGLSASLLVDFEVGGDFDPQGAEPIVLNGFYTQLQVCELVKRERTDASGLLMIDVSDPKNPFIMRTLRPFGGGGTPSAIRRANGRYLIGDLGGTGANVRFYETNTDDLRTTTSLDNLGNWGVYTHFGCVEEDAELGTDDCSEGDRTAIWIGGTEYPWPDDAQGFNLVRDQKTNALYAFLFDNNTDPLSSGDDIAVMLRVNEAAIETWNPKAIMTFLGSKQFEANDAGQGAFSPGIAPMGDFEAAASLYVSPTGQMILYAAMHDGSTLDGKKIVEMGEFRSRSVMAPATSYRGPGLFQCGVDLPVTVVTLWPPQVETRTPCAGVGPSCVFGGPVLSTSYADAYTVDGAECRTCQDVSDCVQNYYQAQCGTVFNYDYLPWAQQQFGPGPVYPVTEIGRFEVRTFALPPYALVEPWVMLHDEYDGRTLFTSDDPPMSLMMDWADRSDDDFGDLREFDNPGAGSFNDETSDVTYCATPGTEIRLREDSGGGCEFNVLTVKDDDADGVAHFVSLPDEVDDETSCVRLLGSLGKDDTIHWSVDGVPLVLSTAGPEVAIDGASLGPGTHTLTARIWNRTAGATIVVAASNLAPTFTAAAPPAVNEDAGATVVAGWAVFDPTADESEPDEAGQTVLGYQVVAVSNPGLFASGPAVAPDGALTYTPAANAFGISTFDVTVQDSGGTASGGVDTSASKSFTITVRSVNDAPSFTAANPSAVLEDAGPQTVAFATFSAGPASESGQAVAAYTVSDVSVAALFASGPSVDASGQLTFTPAANASGSSTFRVRVRDDGGTDRGGVDTSPARTFTIAVTPVNDAPVALPTGSPATQTVQYSDGVAAVTFTASDIDSPSLTLTPDATPLPEGLSLGEATCTPAAIPLIGTGSTCTWVLTGRAGASAGTYDLAFTVRDGGLTAATGTQLVVEPEDAQVTIDQANEVALQVAAAGGTSGAFTLAFTLHEVDEPDDVTGDANLAGDITRGETTMTLVPVGPGSPVAGTCVEVGTTLLKADPDSPHDYEALRVECSFAAVPVNTYSVEVAVVGFAPLAAPSALTVGSAPAGLVIYYSAANTVTVTDVLTIFDPSLGFTTGGGWFRWPGTADEASGYAGDKTNVGYTMKYNKRKTNLQGSLLVVRHLPDGRIVRLKSNALEGLSLGRVAGEFGWAAFSGKGTYQAIGWPEALGNYRFTTYVEDRTVSGGADRFWIEVTDGSAVVQPALSLAKPAPARAEALQGGSIHVP